MRSMWKGSISFGLVTIPVKLYAATEQKDIRFNLLHEECRSPIQYRKFCPSCEKEISGEEIVRGYEYERGRYVIVQDEEMESIPVAAARTLDIVDFVRLEQIDPIYFEKTYYLEPGEGGAKAYALLRKAMEETGRIAIARVVIRSKESLAAIRLFGDGVLAMNTMHFPEEIRSPAGLTGIVQPELRPQELEMAVNLIASLSSGEFEPQKFQNEYREALLEMIHAKVAGEEVVQPEAQPERGRVVDLMEALRASIRVAEESREGADRPTAAPGPDPAAPAEAPPAEQPIPAMPAPPTPAPAPPFTPPGNTPPPLPGIPPAPGAAAATPIPGVPAAAPPGTGMPNFNIPGAPTVPPPAPGRPTPGQ